MPFLALVILFFAIASKVAFARLPPILAFGVSTVAFLLGWIAVPKSTAEERAQASADEVVRGRRTWRK